MRKMLACILHASFILFRVCSLNAVSLDGSSSIVYKTKHHTFHDQDTVQGFVDLCKGFTVIPLSDSTHGANLYMDTNVSVSGAIDLRGTSTLTLLRNLYLDEGVTFSDSGKIYSYGSALNLQGNLTIPADKVLYCGGNLIINGLGNTLTVGSNAQIFLDNNATLTLRNMIIKTSHDFPGQPSLNFSSTLSQLTLDNVELSLGNDLHVKTGQIFFYNDVVVTGTSVLVYRSSAPSYIAPHATLMFDRGTTFSFAPATNNKDLIVLKDASSSLVFNCSSLKSTHTGMRLTKGRLYLDDKVNVDSSAINKILGLSVLDSKDYGNYIYSTAWTSNGKYLAIAGANPTSGNELQVYSFNGSTLSATTGLDCGGTVYTTAWTPDGKYLAIGGMGLTSGNELQLYRFNGATLSAVTSQDYGSSIKSLAWSPDGKYLAIGGNGATTFGGIANTNELQIYRFDGQALTTVTSQGYGSYIDSLAWSPDGKYLAIGGSTPTTFGGGASSNEFQVYRFSGLALTAVASQDYGSIIRALAWSPDGQYVAIGGNWPTNSDELQIYRFNGITLNAITTQGYGTSSTTDIYSIAWSPDGCYLAISGRNAATFGGSANTDELQIYQFNGSSIRPITSQSFGASPEVFSTAWSPDGQFLASGGYGFDGANELWINKISFGNETATQSFDKSIIFGNSAQNDATYDLEIHVLSGANVQINGKIYHDPYQLVVS
jgi:WD40 repeat protein